MYAFLELCGISYQHPSTTPLSKDCSRTLIATTIPLPTDSSSGLYRTRTDLDCRTDDFLCRVAHSPLISPQPSTFRSVFLHQQWPLNETVLHPSRPSWLCMRFYCDYHENIRAIHLSVTLPSAPDELTSLDIYDRKTLRLRHAFRSYTIALPASVDPTRPLEVKGTGLTLNCRVSADPIVRSDGSISLPLSSPEALQEDVLCSACGTCMILASRGLTWHRMPSENWAEMMDSWHCHRGVSDHHYNEHHDQYTLPDHIVSAAERIRARPGRGLIGLSYLLIHPSDTQNIKVRRSTIQDSRENQIRSESVCEC